MDSGSIPRESSGMEAFLQEYVGHQKVQLPTTIKEESMTEETSNGTLELVGAEMSEAGTCNSVRGSGTDTTEIVEEKTLGRL